MAVAVGTARAAIEVRVELAAPAMQQLAAKEVARYIYLRTGLLPKDFARQRAIIIARKDSAMVSDAAVRTAARDLQPQQYVLKTTAAEGKTTWWIIGGDDQGTLYGAYRFAEKLGVRFYLHGDVVPDQRLEKIPDLDETGKPLFALRGVNPWGSHPFGFDAWGTDDYKAVFTQLAKMRMNFLSIHCYPEGHPYAEPTVWHGLPGDFDAQGRVKASYPARYYNTAVEGFWGPVLPRKTGDYSYGAALLFDRDDWAPEVMRGHCPAPAAPEACNEVFNRMAGQFREAFGFARRVGLKTCIGTEAPLILPKALQERIKAQGKDPKAPTTVREVYEVTFRRIMASHPLDYYWIWTPEGWTWEGNKPEQYAATLRDLKLAYEARKAVAAPFQLATCGWVLGPQHDRAALDADLPKDMPTSAISRKLGHEEVDPALGRIRGREKWAIPWLESDALHGLAAVQLFAGRTRRDAADALAYGCTGLMGLHWRTDILSPNAAALAQAAWDQSGWNPSPGHVPAQAAPPAKLEPGVANRGLPCGDFYADWAAANFGPEAGPAVGRLFTSLDGKVPISVADGCPSGYLRPDPQPWEQARKPFAFVDELASLRPTVKGPGNLDRFDYWLNTFRYHRLLAEIRCALGVFEAAMKAAEAMPDPSTRRQQAEAKALPAYQEVVRLYGEACRMLLATVSTPGGLATVVNLQNHNAWWPVAIGKPAARLAAALGGPLPNDALPPKQYEGPPRIIVPTVRSLLVAGEPLPLKVIVLDNQPATAAAILWRPLGTGPFRTLPLKHVARAVYEVELPSPGGDFEYRIEATTARGAKLIWPATAPQMNQTVVVWK